MTNEKQDQVETCLLITSWVRLTDDWRPLARTLQRMLEGKIEEKRRACAAAVELDGHRYPGNDLKPGSGVDCETDSRVNDTCRNARPRPVIPDFLSRKLQDLYQRIRH